MARKKLVRKKSKVNRRKHKVPKKNTHQGVVPLRKSHSAEEQSAKMFIMVGISIALIVILALFLFLAEREAPFAGESIYVVESTCADGSICLQSDGTIFDIAEIEAGDEFTVRVIGQIDSSVSGVNLAQIQLNYDESMVKYDSYTSDFSGSGSQWDFENLGTSADPSDITKTILEYAAAAFTDEVVASSGKVVLVELIFKAETTLVDGDIFTISFGEDSTLEGTDGTNLLDDSTFTDVTFSVPENNVPEITDIDDQSATVGEEFSYLVVASDADADTLSYGVSLSGDETITIDESGVITWIPTAAGSYTINVNVDDGEDFAETFFTITVVEEGENNAPIISDIETQIVTMGDEFTYTIDASDADADTLSYSVSLSGDETITVDESGVITWTAVATGDHTINVGVSDGEDLTETSFTVTVIDEVGPEIEAIDSQTATVDVEFTYTVVASDPNGDDVLYTGISIDSDDETIIIGDTTGVISWTPTAAGDFEIEVTASDATYSESETFTVTVSEADEETTSNTAPSFITIGGEEVVSGTTISFDLVSGEDFELNVVAEDSESDDLTLSVNVYDLVGDNVKYSYSETENDAEITKNDYGDWTFIKDIASDTDEGTYALVVKVVDSSDESVSKSVYVVAAATSEEEDSEDEGDVDTPVEDSSEDITVSVSLDGTEVSALDLVTTSTYDIEVVVSGDVEEDHLLILQVSDSEGEVQSLTYQSMAAIASGETEELSVSFTPNADESYVVNVYVWSDWPLNGGSDLLTSVEVS